MEAIRGVRLRKFKLRKIILGVRMHFRHIRSVKISYTECITTAFPSHLVQYHYDTQSYVQLLSNF